jgi:5,10-methylenetetrahydromethanopterin reductase
MRLAVAASGASPSTDVLELARACDGLAVDELWLTEDYYERGAFALAGAVLASTSRLSVGIGVVNPWTRHPVLIAMEAAALAEIGPGRVTLGLGSSNARWMDQQLGIAFERPLSRLGSAVTIIRAALAGAPVDQEWGGRRLDARLSFTPPQPVPLALGVKGERALRLAAGTADVILLSAMSSPAYVRWVRDLVGPGPRLDVLVGVSLQEDGEPNASAARDRIRAFVATYLGVHGDQPITRVAGLDAATATALRAGWAAGTPRVGLITDELMVPFCLAGTADDVRLGIAAYAEAGADTLVVQNRGAGGAVSVLEQLSAWIG